MTTRVHSYVTAGIAALAATTIAIAPTSAPPPRGAPTQSVVSQVSKARVGLLAAAQRMTTTVRPQAATASVMATPLNAASDVIVNAWNAVLPWVDYGVNLSDYVLGFIPGLNIVGDQISIVYYSLVRPVANSFVVNLVAPVVNAPLNINSYINGLVTLGSVTVTSLINLGINEFNYFLGWLIPPIPPLPLAAPTTTTPAAQTVTATARTAATAPADLPASANMNTGVADVPAPVKSAMKGTVAPDDGAPDVADEVTENGQKTGVDAVKVPTTTTSTSTEVAIQGEVRGVPNENTAESTKGPKRVKRPDEAPTSKAATESATSTELGGDKHDNKGEKKDDTGKKDRTG